MHAPCGGTFESAPPRLRQKRTNERDSPTVASFDPKNYLIRVQGNREYLPVAARLIWFRQERPDWSIETEPLHLDLEHGVSVYRALIRDENGRIRAQATKMETRKDFADFIEKSETGAIGRALAMCGYGTQFTTEFDEGTRIVDAPQSRPNREPESESEPETETGSPTTPECSNCGQPLTQGQYQFSTRKYGRPLCPRCQKLATNENR